MGSVKDFFFKKRKANVKVVIGILVFSIVFCSLTVYGNFSLDTETIYIRSQKVPYEFDGFKIAHISDFHNKESDFFADDLIDTVRDAQPDIIVITGDIIDKHRTNTKTALLFAGQLTTIAPVYYVRGNHEVTVSQQYFILYTDFINKLEELGVRILMNECVQIQRSPTAKLNLYGLDELYNYVGDFNQFPRVTDELLSEFTINQDELNILLAHHPEQIETYAKHGFDAVFSGHAHAGQFRIFGQGILAPDQGCFPKYTSGLYEVDNTKLILSRGLGNSNFPFRLFNKPHLIIAELQTLY